MTELPEFMTYESLTIAGLPYPKKTFVDGIEIPDVEVACPSRDFVIAAQQHEDGGIFCIEGRDMIARKIVQGKVTFEYGE